MKEFLYRVLVVDDDAGFLRYARLYEETLRDLAYFTYVGSKSEALEEIRRHRYHLISIDQHIPDRPGEAALHEHGLALCAELSISNPLIRRIIYTKHPRYDYARQAGSMDDTDYFEKAASPDAPNGLKEYFGTIIRSRLLGYLSWAMDRSRYVLPQSFGAACATLSGLADDQSWDDAAASMFANKVSWIWERTVWLAWAHSCMLAAAAGCAEIVGQASPEETGTYVTKSLSMNWEATAKEGWLRTWRKYITREPSKGGMDRPGGAFFDASNDLRHFRNEAAHHVHEGVSRRDLQRLSPALLVWTDALAFWADHPLILGPRFHPSDRERLQYTRLAGPAPWRVESAYVTAKLPPDRVRQRHIFALHSRGDEQRFVDLFPLISMVERQGSAPEPALVLPAGRSAKRISLQSGAEIAAPLTEDERTAIQLLFNGRWRV